MRVTTCSGYGGLLKYSVDFSLLEKMWAGGSWRRSVEIWVGDGDLEPGRSFVSSDFLWGPEGIVAYLNPDDQVTKFFSLFTISDWKGSARQARLEVGWTWYSQGSHPWIAFGKYILDNWTTKEHHRPSTLHSFEWGQSRVVDYCLISILSMRVHCNLIGHCPQISHSRFSFDFYQSILLSATCWGRMLLTQFMTWAKRTAALFSPQLQGTRAKLSKNYSIYSISPYHYRFSRKGATSYAFSFGLIFHPAVRERP